MIRCYFRNGIPADLFFPLDSLIETKEYRRARKT